MDLFSKDKDIINRITNLVLVIWLVGSMFAISGNIINAVVTDPVLTFEEYRAQNCQNFFYEKGDELTDEEKTERCLNEYEMSKIWAKESSYRNNRDILVSFANFAIVGTALFLLNKKK
jgi:hypothetical protein